MGCTTSIAKLILFIFNICFFIFGVVSLGVGIWVRVAKNSLFNFVNLIDSKITDGASKTDINNIAEQPGMIVTAAYVLIAVGVVTLIVGFCGCCGAINESPMLLNIYAALVGLVLVLEIVVAILAIAFKSKVEDNVMKRTVELQKKYYISLPDYIKDNSTAKAAVTYLINFMQISLRCCGAETLNDLSNSSSWLNSSRIWNNRTIVTPITCCKLKDDAAYTGALTPGFNWTEFTNSLEDPQCPFTEHTENSKSIHQKTCVNEVKSSIGTYSTTIAAVCLAIGLIEILGIVFACCLVNALRNN